MTPLKRAARAIELADEAFVAQYPGEAVVARACPNWSRALARAMLRALYEPSDAMIDAGDKHTGNWTLERGREDGTSAYPAWQAMIDEALRT